MGCDIHLILEKKVNDKWLGVWDTDTIPNGGDLLIVERRYDFFSNLATVRSDKGRPPKGLPDNISELTKLSISAYDGDVHSTTHFTAKEFCNIFIETCKNYLHLLKGVEFKDDCPMHELLGIDSWENENDYRVIIYFDN